MSSRSSRDVATELLLAEPERLEPGLVSLDSRLRLDEDVEIDVLLRDSLGYPVVVLFCDGDVAGELSRMAGAAEVLRRGRYLLNRLYHNKGLDPSLRPRFVLLGTRFPDSAPRVLEMMTGVEVAAVEYRIVESSVGRPVLDLAVFHRTSGALLPSGLMSEASRRPRATRAASPPARPAARAPRREAPAPVDDLEIPDLPDDLGAPARPEARDPQASRGGKASKKGAAPRAAHGDDDVLELAEEGLTGPDLARSLFLRARDSIRALSTHVTEGRDDDRTVFEVDGKTLAALGLESDGLVIQVGDDAAGAGKVSDEETFNERLNSIFTLYFERLGPDRLTA